MPTKSPPPSLILPDPWTVVAKATFTDNPVNPLPLPDHLITWQLCHQGVPMATLEGPNARASLTAVAQQYNQSGIQPVKYAASFADILGEKARQKRMVKKAHQ